MIMQNVFYPVPLEVARSAFGDLSRRGLVSTDEGIFSTMTSSHGLGLVGEGTRVTPLGRKFIQFCAVPQQCQSAPRLASWRAPLPEIMKNPVPDREPLGSPARL